MSGHTPGKWYIKWQSHIFSDDRLVANTGGHADSGRAHKTQLENQANARRIVTAVNAHDKLLAACKASLNFIQQGCPLDSMDNVHDLLRAAITLAGDAL